MSEGRRVWNTLNHHRHFRSSRWLKRPDVTLNKEVIYLQSNHSDMNLKHKIQTFACTVKTKNCCFYSKSLILQLKDISAVETLFCRKLLQRFTVNSLKCWINKGFEILTVFDCIHWNSRDIFYCKNLQTCSWKQKRLDFRFLISHSLSEWAVSH